MLKLNVVCSHKQRDKTGKISEFMVIGNKELYEGKTGIIIDDILDSCGTMNTVVTNLIGKGLKDAILIATHGIFTGDAIRLINNNPAIKLLITTNSLPQYENIKQCSKIVEIYAIVNGKN